MPNRGYWKGLWKCKRCGKKLDKFQKICDDCIREIYEKEVPEIGVSGAAKKYGITRQALIYRASKIFS